MKKNKSGFSFIEIIIVISILIILWMVAVTSYDSSVDNSKNTKIDSDLKTLNNSITSYFTESKEYPNPKWNLKFYNIDGWYEHNYDDENTFGVSWFITDTMIDKKYIQFLPLDPRTNQYYAYAKTKKYTWFQIAWIIRKNNINQTILNSHWDGLMYENMNYMPYLIKEYNGPKFITSNSTEHFPYNPEERNLTAKINTYSGNITINEKTSLSPDYITNSILWEWDTIKVSTWWTIELYYSDGSTSLLWDTNASSEITLSQMRYIEENNLFTSIKISLNMGAIWTKASKLADKSEFQIETPNAVAAVRGTIFWISYNLNTTNVNLIEWKLELQERKNNQYTPISWWWIIWWGSDIFTYENEKSYLEVTKWQSPKWIYLQKYMESTQIQPNFNIEFETEKEIIHNFLNNREDSDEDEDGDEPKKDAFLERSIECSDGFTKFNNVCVEFVEESEAERTDTGRTIFKLYKDILNRKPDRKWFEFWMQHTNPTTLSYEFTKAGYKNYLKKEETYFLWDRCSAQNSFLVNQKCIQNTLFKVNDTWKVLGYAPLNTNLLLFTENSAPIEPTNANHLSTQKYLKYDSSHHSFYINTPYVNYWKENLWQAGLDSKTLNFSVSKVSNEKNYDIYNWKGTKWILIDNDNINDNARDQWADTLMYDGDKIWNYSKDNLWVEISVRGWALKRKTDTMYTLMHLDNWIVYQNKTWIEATLNGKKFTLSIPDNITNNDFYKILTYKENDILIWLTLTDSENNILAQSKSETGTTTSWSVSLTNDLYIGNKWSYNQWSYNQWNDIIDSVTLYSK